MKSPIALVLKTNTAQVVTNDEVLLELYKSSSSEYVLSDEELDSGEITNAWHKSWYARCVELFGPINVKMNEGEFSVYDVVEEINIGIR